MTVSDNTIQAEGLGGFSKILGRVFAKAGTKLDTNVVEKPGRALEIGANVGTAFASRIPKEILSSLPEVTIFNLFLIYLKIYGLLI